MSQGGPVSASEWGAAAPEPTPQPLAVEPVDNLHAIAYAAAEAVPQLQIYRRAELSMRVAAAGFDVLLCGAVFVAMAFLFFVTGLNRLFWWVEDAGGGSLIALLMMHLWLLVTLTEVFGRATPGKVLTNIRLASADFTPTSARQRISRWAIRRSPEMVLLAMAWLFFIENTTSLHVAERTYDLMLLTLAATQFLVLMAFIPCGAGDRQAFYDRILGMSVIESNAGRRGHSGSAFGVVTRGPER